MRMGAYSIVSATFGEYNLCELILLLLLLLLCTTFECMSMENGSIGFVMIRGCTLNRTVNLLIELKFLFKKHLLYPFLSLQNY